MGVREEGLVEGFGGGEGVGVQEVLEEGVLLLELEDF